MVADKAGERNLLIVIDTPEMTHPIGEFTDANPISSFFLAVSFVTVRHVVYSVGSLWKFKLK